MYDISKGNCETFFSDLFQLTSKKHKIKTRQTISGKFRLPVARTNYKSELITNFGVRIWNYIPKILDFSYKKDFRKAVQESFTSDLLKIEYPLV